MFWVYLAIPTSGVCMMVYILGHVIELLSVGVSVQDRKDVRWLSSFFSSDS